MSPTLRRLFTLGLSLGLAACVGTTSTPAPDASTGAPSTADKAAPPREVASPGTASPAPPPPGSLKPGPPTPAYAIGPSGPAAAPVTGMSTPTARSESRLAGGSLPIRPPMPAPMTEREQYQQLTENPVRQVAEAPVSTFSIDVDTGSWTNVRRLLNAGRLPPRDAVRVEEFLNYFPYDYARPTDGRPFAVHTGLAVAPWNPERLLMRVAIKAEDRSIDRLPPANLVFLIDVSGSMAQANKLPLLQSALKLLTARLRPQDRLSIVTYASGTTTPLVAVPGNEKARIVSVIDSLRASGSTAGASGIEAAYRVATEGFIRDGINRILLATDGDFNVGVTDFGQLRQMVETRRASGVSLSTLGFGTGNINERLMEQLADAGDGAYSYIDTLMEGQKVLVTEMSSTLATVARDVKIQVEFNPALVSEYRLIGYENRMLAREDFNNDKVDAGDVGAGHAVTALYELTPAGARGSVDPLRYGSGVQAPGPGGRHRGETAFVRVRYKPPGEDASRLIELPVAAQAAPDLRAADPDFRFAAGIAAYGQILRGGRWTGAWTIADARALAASGLGADGFGYRAEALRLMDLAAALSVDGKVVSPPGGVTPAAPDPGVAIPQRPTVPPTPRPALPPTAPR